MKNITLNIDYKTRPQKLANKLRYSNLKQGDKLTVTTLIDEEMSWLIVAIAIVVFQRLKIDYADKVIKDIFESKDSKYIKKEIAREYGIEIEVNTITEEYNWNQFSKENLAKAYGAEESEYDLSMVKEPNPDYNKK